MYELALREAVKYINSNEHKLGAWFIWRNQPSEGFLVAVYLSRFNVQRVVLLKPTDDAFAWQKELADQGWVRSDLRVDEKGNLC